ncbi:MAG TPA: FlgD immunoglobulin-like domain containing protein [Candidatus Deferrimicrobium sp.]|nr:FlgD immunoglobulin-like domain containing protein [Candidatus Deferrimicrobium sp.]
MKQIRLVGLAMMSAAAFLLIGSSLFGYASLDYFVGPSIVSEHWVATNVHWRINNLSQSKYFNATNASFASWQALATPITFTYDGTSTIRNDADDGVNLISFNNTYTGWGSVLGFTVNYNVNSTGEIYGFDIMLNPKARWSTDGTPSGTQFEAQAVLTHEIGHSQGLAHSVTGNATMYPFISQGSVASSSLEDDDHISHLLLYGPSSYLSANYGKFTGNATHGATGLPVKGAAIQAFPPGATLYSQSVSSMYTYSAGTYELWVNAGSWLLRMDPLDGSPSAFDPNRINEVLIAIAEIGYPAEWWNTGESCNDDVALATTLTIADGATQGPYNFIANDGCPALSPRFAEDSGPLPESFSLYQNTPNPFNPTTTITYALPSASNVDLVVLNVLGQTVRTLVSGHESAGLHEVEWDGRSNAGQSVSSGIYFYRLTSAGVSNTKKMLLMK